MRFSGLVGQSTSEGRRTPAVIPPLAVIARRCGVKSRRFSQTNPVPSLSVARRIIATFKSFLLRIQDIGQLLRSSCACGVFPEISVESANWINHFWQLKMKKTEIIGAREMIIEVTSDNVELCDELVHCAAPTR